MANAIKQYVRDAGGCKADCRKAIMSYFDENPEYVTTETVVYRGQTVNNTIDPKTRNTFFSVSTDIDVAGDFARGGYLFKIHLKPGVQHIPVGDILSENSEYDFENEFFIRGGGIFTYISTTQEKEYTVIEVEYSYAPNKSNAANKSNAVNKSNKNRNGRNNKKRTRKVSRRNVMRRAINEGFPENLINNNILITYLGTNEELGNNA